MLVGAIFVAVLAMFVVNLLLIPQYDLGQCTRKCRWEVLGPRGMDDESIIGEKDSFETCRCIQKGKTIKENLKRLYDEYPPGFPYLDHNLTVCGVDGNTYPTANDASRKGVKIINCGPCGDCSTVQDVSIYRHYANPMTKMLSRCALLYVFLGPDVARVCLRYMFSLPDGKPEKTTFTPKCMNRFIDNYGCTLSHCYKECLFQWNNPLSSNNNEIEGLSHTGRADGTKLNPCMLCDEVYCSPVFISSGGANRRCSGTVTDIARPGEEVCKYVNAL